MFCPRCGQQQVSENIKFCSRCGFSMELISDILAHGGVLPQLLDLGKNKKLLTRKNGLKAALIWAIAMWVLFTPFFGVIGADELAGMAAILGFAGGVLLTLISFLFLDNKPAISQTGVSMRSDYAQNNLGGVSSGSALPPHQSVPASAYAPPAGKWQTTNDLTAPPSVTESTTKLLQKDE